jgi:hypothetical protein
LLFGLAGFRAGDSRFNGRFARVDGFGGGLNVSRWRPAVRPCGFRAGDSRFNGRFARVDGFGRAERQPARPAARPCGLCAGDSGFNGGFARVDGFGGGLHVSRRRPAVRLCGLWRGR